MEGKRFILIDDDRVANMLSGTLINRHVADAALHIFSDPLEGLAFLKENTQPAILFLDINMPRMSGWDLLQHLEKQPPQLTSLLKIYILSSSIDPEDRHRANNHPLVTGYIEKPITDSFFG